MYFAVARRWRSGPDDAAKGRAMGKPRCPKCNGYLKSDYSFLHGQTKKLINCINCGWYGFPPASNEEAKQEEVDADLAAILAPVLSKAMSIIPKNIPIMPIIQASPLKDIKQKETTMSTQKGTCPTCKREGVSMPFLDKCHRCYDRIRKGKDPLTGKPKVISGDNSAVSGAGESFPHQAEFEANKLADDVKRGLIRLGYKAFEVTREFNRAAFAADVTAEEMTKFIVNQLSGKGPVKQAAQPPAVAPAAAEVRPTPPAEPAPTIIYQNDPIVRFKGKDREMLKWLYEQAEFNRRTLEQEILFRLDRSFDGRRAVLAVRQQQYSR